MNFTKAAELIEAARLHGSNSSRMSFYPDRVFSYPDLGFKRDALSRFAKHQESRAPCGLRWFHLKAFVLQSLLCSC